MNNPEAKGQGHLLKWCIIEHVMAHINDVGYFICLPGLLKVSER